MENTTPQFKLAMRLLEAGPESEGSKEWQDAADNLASHRIENETATETALRIACEEHWNVLKILSNPESVRMNLVVGRIAWTWETLESVLKANPKP